MAMGDGDVTGSPSAFDLLNQASSVTETINIWADGCYDIGHFGHANSLRQAKAFGDRLIVGVHSDEEIKKNKKCSPVFTETERYAMVKAMKWVDEVVKDAPYVTSLETLDRYGCRYCAHGNDVTTDADGKDCYHIVKSANRYKEVERTRGVSTTDIIRRILEIGKPKAESHPNAPFLLTMKKIKQFVSPIPRFSGSSNVVYASGAFDLFHPGHIQFLEAAAAKGDYLIVGVHNDETVKKYKGDEYPILNLTERMLSVSACKFVHEVIIGAPYSITKELLEEFKVNTVVRGVQEAANDPDTHKDPYALAKQLGKFQILDSQSDLTAEKIVARVLSRRSEFEARNASKEKKENEIAASIAADAEKQDVV